MAMTVAKEISMSKSNHTHKAQLSLDTSFFALHCFPMFPATLFPEHLTLMHKLLV